MKRATFWFFYGVLVVYFLSAVATAVAT